MKRKVSLLLILSLVFSMTGITTYAEAAQNEIKTYSDWDFDFGWDDDQNDDWGDDYPDDDYDDPYQSEEPEVTPTPTPTPTPKVAKLSQTTMDLKKGKSKKLTVKNYTGTIKWTSTNKKIATVSSKGVVKAKKVGSVTIKAKCTGINKTLSCKVKIYKKFTPSGVRKKILSYKKSYPEGKHWTNSNYYLWKAIYTRCYGCIAFVGKISDKVFGKKTKVKRHRSFKKIKAGDHIRIGDYHSVIVLSKSGNKLTVAEGNYNSSIHWGRTITKSELNQEGFYVETRY